jgi:hypothetical protein
MNRILGIVVVLVSLLLFLGCESAAEESLESQIESETGKDAEVDLDKDKVTIESEGQKVEVEGSNLKGDEWCKAGSQWKMSSTGDEGSMNAQWLIEGLVSSGEYKGLCHVVYTAKGDQGNAKMDYYFAEDGKTGYYEMDINGQKIKSQWQG